MKKTIKLTQEDINLAIKERRTNPSITRSCPIFQALQRSGVDVRGVGFDCASLNNGNTIYLSESVSKATNTIPSRWSELKPISFTISDKKLV